MQSEKMAWKQVYALLLLCEHHAKQLDARLGQYTSQHSHAL